MARCYPFSKFPSKFAEPVREKKGCFDFTEYSHFKENESQL